MSKTSENNKTDMSKISENKKIELKNGIKLDENDIKAISDEFLGKKRFIGDIVIKSVTLTEQKIVKLVSYDGEYYIDFRNYYKSYPTRKGFRMPAKYFKTVVSGLNDEIEKYVE